MNELLAKFKGLKSLHLLGKGKTFKKGHLGIKRGLIRKKEGTPYYVQKSFHELRSAFLTEGKGNNNKKNEI